MSTSPSSSPWDFGPVFDLLREFSTDHDATVSTKPFTPPKNHEHQDSRPARLGDLDDVLRLMGRPIDIPLSQSTPVYDSTTSAAASYSTDASSPPEEDVLDFDDLVKNKEVRFSDDTLGIGSSPPVRKLRVSDKLNWKTIDAGEIERLVESEEAIRGEGLSLSLSKASKRTKWRVKNGHASDFESDGEALPFTEKSILPSARLLTPAWVKPPSASSSAAVNQPWIIPPDVPQIQLQRSTITPFITLTREEKKALLVRKLMRDFAAGSMSLLHVNASRVASSFGGNTSSNGLHVFVDASNIVIGFWNALKLARGMSKHEFTKRAPFDFHSLSLVLERGRTATKRVLCGSLESTDAEPDYMTEARYCGYSVSGLKRVEKVRPIVASKRRGGNGYATSGPSSGSDAYTRPMPNVGEQAVDELLQLHMCTSVLEFDIPSTMVLATGDAAEAEYSGGFQKYVELALAKGWKVELVCWKEGMSYAWIRPDFLKKWKQQFTIIHLDEYREELFADYVEAQPAVHLANWDN